MIEELRKKFWEISLWLQAISSDMSEEDDDRIVQALNLCDDAIAMIENNSKESEVK